MKRTLLAAALISASAASHAGWVTKDLGSLNAGGWVSGLSITGNVIGARQGANYKLSAFHTSSGAIQGLEAPDWEYGEATSVNASGLVTVTVVKTDGGYGAYLYRNGVLAELPFNNMGMTIKPLLNEIGQIGGTAGMEAFLYSHGTLSTLTMGEIPPSVTAINASGQLAGQGTLADNSTRAFIYSKGVVTELGLLPGGTYSGVSGLNDAGQAAGSAMLGDPTTYHAFRYSGGAMTDLGTLGGKSSGASAINGAGQVVGAADTATPGVYHAFVANGDQLVDLGTLGGARSYASGINGAGQIVGVSELANGDGAPFLYDQGAMHNLNNLVTGFTELQQYVLLNDAGQLAGIGKVNGEDHVFLLSYTPDELGQSAATPTAALSVSASSQTAGTTSKAGTSGTGGRETRTAATKAALAFQPPRPFVAGTPGLTCLPPYCGAPGKKK
jgi:probable HAF family extracellular repeat protein